MDETTCYRHLDQMSVRVITEIAIRFAASLCEIRASVGLVVKQRKNARIYDVTKIS